MIEKLRTFLKVPELKRRLAATALIFAVFRFVASVPAPGADPEAVRQLFTSSQFLGLLNVVSGGVMENFSIVLLGLNPYINASILLQLMTKTIPQLEELSKEGEYGRQKINQYTRFLTIPLATLQAFGMYFLLNSQGVVGVLSPTALFQLVVTLVAGTTFLMWLGEQLSEYGIGNGISMLIFAGIVSAYPRAAAQTAFVTDAQQLFSVLGIGALAITVVYMIVKVNEGARRIPIRYARRVRGRRLYGGHETHLPLRVNQAGVIPVIFAISLVLLPSMVGQFLQGSSNELVANVSRELVRLFQPNQVIYNVLYFLLVVGFTYFYTAVTFNPDKIAEDVKKNGGFIPGIRPGKATADYINYILTRITLVGGIFLGTIAVLPSVTQGLTGITTLAIGGTGLLIVVSVILDTLKQIEALLVTREYEGFL